MKIRKINYTDHTKVKKMVCEILKNIFNGNPTQFPILKELSIRKNYLLYLVAEDKNKIIGCAALKKINKDTARLKRLYVKEEYRGKGIAQKMLNQIIEFSQQNNFKQLKFSAYPIMEDVHHFLKKNKFKKTKGNDIEQIHVIRDL